MEEEKRVAIYIRVSTVEQAEEGYSLDMQRKTLTDYCTSKGYDVYNVYADEGISAKDITHRPQMQQLICDAKQKLFDIVLVWKLTRFTRSLSDLCKVCDMLDKNNITFISFSENFDCSTPMGRFTRNLLGVVAQWEREVIGENVRAAMDERAAQGKRTCSYLLGYDVIKGGDMTINHKEAEIVRFIYSKYLSCNCIVDVSRACKSKGFVGKKGGELKEESIHKILTRFIYCGYYSWRRMPIKGDFEPIIDIPTYNEVQRIMLRRGKYFGRVRQHELVMLPEL